MNHLNSDEALFRQRLQGLDITPPPSVWERIAAEERKRRAAAWWWWGGASGMLLAGFAFLLAYTLGTSHKPGGATLTTAGSIIQDFSTPTPVKQEIVTPDRRVNGEESIAIASSPVRSTSPASNGATKTNKKAQTKPNEAATLTPTEAPIASDQTRLSPVVESEIPAVVTRETNPTIHPQTEPFISLPHAGLSALEERTMLLKVNALPAIPKAKRKKQTQECYHPGTQHFTFSAEGYLSPDVALKQLLLRNADLQKYFDSRQSSESSFYTYSAGLRAIASYNNEWSLSAGLHYTQINEIFRYSLNKTILEIQDRYIQTNNGPVLIRDTVFKTGMINNTIYDRYRMLDIALLAGYQFHQGKMVFRASAGAMLNLLFVQRGQLYNENLAPADLSGPNRPEIFADKAGVSLWGSLQVQYRFKSKAYLFAEPYWRQMMQPVSLAGAPIEQRYGIGGCLLGVGYQF